MKRLEVFNGERIYTDGLTHLQSSLSDAIKERQNGLWSKGTVLGLEVTTSPTNPNSLRVAGGEAYNSNGERIFVPSDVDNVNYGSSYLNSSPGTYTVVARYKEDHLPHYEIGLDGTTHYTHITDSYSISVLKEGIDTILETDVRLSDIIVTVDGGTYIYDTSNRDKLVSKIIDGVTSSKIIQDSDGDTKIEVERIPDDDHIRFTAKGNETAVIDENSLDINGDVNVDGNIVASGTLDFNVLNADTFTGVVATFNALTTNTFEGTSIEGISVEAATGIFDGITTTAVFPKTGNIVNLVGELDVTNGITTTTVVADNSAIKTNLNVSGNIDNVWQRVYSTTLGSASTTVVIPGLDGDTDIEYKFKVMIKSAVTGVSGFTVGIYFNGDTSDTYGWRRDAYGTSTSTSDNADPNIRVGELTSSTQEWLTLEGYIQAKSGLPRTILFRSSEVSTDDKTVTSIMYGSGSWSNTTNNLTSITFISSVVSSLDENSRFELSARRA